MPIWLDVNKNPRRMAGFVQINKKLEEDTEMNPNITQAAGTYLAPKFLRAFRLRYLIFGAMAYYGLRLMSKRGIFPEQADAALDVIDRGIGALKNQVGLGSTTSQVETLH